MNLHCKILIRLVLPLLILWMLGGCQTLAEEAEELLHIRKSEFLKIARPNSAKGAILYIPGSWRTSRTSIDLDNRRVPAVLGALVKIGWDVFRVNKLRHDGEDFYHNADRTVRALQVVVAEKRKQGYKQIVLAGHSAGAWISLRYAGEHKYQPVDAVIAAAPAQFTARVSAERGYTRNMNRTELPAVLKRISNTKVAMVFFYKDPFDDNPNARHRSASKIFNDAKISHHLLVNPSGIIGHSGIWHRAMAYYQSDCMAKFLEQPAQGGRLVCIPTLRSTTSHQWFQSSDDLRRTHIPKLAGNKMRAVFKPTAKGLTIRFLNTRGAKSVYRLAADGKYQAKFNEGTKRQRNSKGIWEIRKDNFCLSSGRGRRCYDVYLWSKNEVIFSHTKKRRLLFFGKTSLS